MPTTKERHHEEPMVHDAVGAYADAIEARPDLDDKQKKEAVAKYRNQMSQLWESPKRGNAKK